MRIHVLYNLTPARPQLAVYIPEHPVFYTYDAVLSDGGSIVPFPAHTKDVGALVLLTDFVVAEHSVWRKRDLAHFRSL